MIDVILLLIFAAVTWCVASEGSWGAALTCLAVIFSGLVAMNTFEPLAQFLENNVASGDWSYRWDFIALVGSFTLLVFLIRLWTDNLLPTFVAMHKIAHEVGRWGAALLAGYATVGILLAALHTAPLPRSFLGFNPERKNFLSISAPDRQWLGFVQYCSERSLAQQGGGQFAKIFDGARANLGDPANPYPNDVWPSFPIRYAARRLEYSGSSGAPAGGGSGLGTSPAAPPPTGGASGAPGF